MVNYAIETFNLTKTFEVAKKKEGAFFWSRFLLKRERNEIIAVDHINLRARAPPFVQGYETAWGLSL